MLFCRFCGNKLPDASTFCAYCGSRLQPLTEEAASTSASHTTMATPALPPEVLTLHTSPLQADLANDEEEEESLLLLLDVGYDIDSLYLLLCELLLLICCLLFFRDDVE